MSFLSPLEEIEQLKKQVKRLIEKNCCLTDRIELLESTAVTTTSTTTSTTTTSSTTTTTTIP